MIADLGVLAPRRSASLLPATVGIDDPPVAWGYDYEETPCKPTGLTFSELVFEAVDTYEHKLDEWQAMYERYVNDPVEADVAERARLLPGMSKRLARR